MFYSYCNFFVRDVRGEFGLISVRLFGILPAIVLRKVREKLRIFCLVSDNLIFGL